MLPDLTPEQQIALMGIDLEVEGIIRTMDETMPELSEIDRGLVINYIRWGWIDGYTQCYRELDETARASVRDPSAWPL